MLEQMPTFELPAWELAFYDAENNEIKRVPTNGGQWLMDQDGTLHNGIPFEIPADAASVVLYGHDGLRWSGEAAESLTLGMG